MPRVRTAIQRILNDIRHLRNIDIYSACLIAFLFAGLSIGGDSLPDGPRWAAVLAGIGILIYRSSAPFGPRSTTEELLQDRDIFSTDPISERLLRATEVFVYGPSCINFLNPERIDILRRGPLARRDGEVRVVTLDLANESYLSIAERQLDDSLDFPIQRLKPSLDSVGRTVEEMSRWSTAGRFSHRTIAYNPGFSLLVVDPGLSDGMVIVEFHGFHNESLTGRMHLKLTRRDSARWYAYWIGQFDKIWKSPQEPG